MSKNMFDVVGHSRHPKHDAEAVGSASGPASRSTLRDERETLSVRSTSTVRDFVSEGARDLKFVRSISSDSMSAHAVGGLDEGVTDTPFSVYTHGCTDIGSGAGADQQSTPLRQRTTTDITTHVVGGLASASNMVSDITTHVVGGLVAARRSYWSDFALSH